MANKDYLSLHLRDLPYFRAIVRAVEARFYQQVELRAPVLDIGCGDGHFASVTFERPLEVGLDYRRKALGEASRRRCYHFLVQAGGESMPFPDGFFAGAVSNSVLEHIPEVDSVLEETARVLVPGARFVFCVPNDKFLGSLSVGRFLDRVRLNFLGDAYRSFFNHISRHYHCDPPETWQSRLHKAGFHLDRWWHYLSPQAMAWVEWGHYFGLPSLLARWLTGRWILVPARWNLALTRRLVEQFYFQEPLCEEGVFTYYISTRN